MLLEVILLVSTTGRNYPATFPQSVRSLENLFQIIHGILFKDKKIQECLQWSTNRLILLHLSHVATSREPRTDFFRTKYQYPECLDKFIKLFRWIL